jgi:hypothetical protein
VNGAARNEHLGGADQVGIHEVDREAGIVAADRRIQEQRAAAFEPEHEARQVARVLVVDAELRGTEAVDVAEPVEDRECVAVLEHPRPVVEPRRRRQDVEVFADADELVGHHAADSGMASVPPSRRS